MEVKKLSDENIKTGLEHVPAPIVEHVRRVVGERPNLPKVYHITEVCYCLRKAFFKRLFPDKAWRHLCGNLKSLFNIYRGRLFDDVWTRQFKVNQRTLLVRGKGVFIVGTLDFVWDGVLYDLKVPNSTFYKKRNGAGLGYRRQVQAYLAMAHSKGQLLDVHRCCVMMYAEDMVFDWVEPDDKILDWILERAQRLDEALEKSDVSGLEGPEMGWECNPDYCPFVRECEEAKSCGGIYEREA